MGNHRSFCPLNLMLEVIGDRWSLLILRDIIFENKRHFRQLLQSEEKIASNVLTDRLNSLEREGLLSRRPDPGHKQKVIYSLTEKSIDLVPFLVEAVTWSCKYEPVNREKYKYSIDLVRGGPAGQLQLREQLIKDHLMQG